MKINDSSNTNGKITKSNSNQRLFKVNNIEMKEHLNSVDGIEKDTSCDINFMKNKKLMIVLLLRKKHQVSKNNYYSIHHYFNTTINIVFKLTFSEYITCYFMYMLRLTQYHTSFIFY